MTDADVGEPGSKLAAALERSQQEERVEAEEALRHEQELSERLAAELARRRSDSPD